MAYRIARRFIDMAANTVGQVSSLYWRNEKHFIEQDIHRLEAYAIRLRSWATEMFVHRIDLEMSNAQRFQTHDVCFGTLHVFFCGIVKHVH